MINALYSAEADAVCGAEWGQVSPERVNQRNGYRHPIRCGYTRTLIDYQVVPGSSSVSTDGGP